MKAIQFILIIFSIGMFSQSALGAKPHIAGFNVSLNNKTNVLTINAKYVFRGKKSAAVIRRELSAQHRKTCDDYARNWKPKKQVVRTMGMRILTFPDQSKNKPTYAGRVTLTCKVKNGGSGGDPGGLPGKQPISKVKPHIAGFRAKLNKATNVITINAKYVYFGGIKTKPQIQRELNSQHRKTCQNYASKWKPRKTLVKTLRMNILSFPDQSKRKSSYAGRVDITCQVR